MAVYFSSASISSTSYPVATSPTFTIPFLPKTILLTIDSAGTVPIRVSFDLGVSDSGRIDPSQPKQWEQRVTLIHLKQETAGAAETVYIEAEI